jgi:hypothetical protein
MVKMSRSQKLVTLRGPAPGIGHVSKKRDQ